MRLNRCLGLAPRVGKVGYEIVCSKNKVGRVDCRTCRVHPMRSLRLICSSSVSCACGDASERTLGQLFTYHKRQSSVLVIEHKLLASASVTGVTLFSNGS